MILEWIEGWWSGGDLGVGTTYCNGPMVSPSVKNGTTIGLLGGTMVGLMDGTSSGVFCLVFTLWVWGAPFTTLGAIGLADVGITSATLGSIELSTGWTTLCGDTW